jgi:hypothetical protein
LFSEVLEPVAANAQVVVSPKRPVVASTAISDMCEVIRRIVLE